MSFNIMIRACMQRNFLSYETVLIITFLYLSLLVGFGMIFLIFTQSGVNVLYEGSLPVEGSYLDRLYTCFYFSAVTLFSVGYGDIIPVGYGRLIAVVEALIGYVLPAVFVARTVIGIDKR
ncbi:ion channel [Metabacillus herbersteinensis]